MMRSPHIYKLWYTKHPLRWILWPLALFYSLIVVIRRNYLQRFKQKKYSVPIIVVGNLTVGGVGKTPVVLALAQHFQALGLRVGIVSRGYGAKITLFPHEVYSNDSAVQVGDEPLLLAKKAKCPVVIAPKRTQAVEYLIQKYQSQIIISDDGLQHYKMGRSIEIAVVDGLRGFGNKLCLPAGPLRESVNRLKAVDFVVINGGKSDTELSTLILEQCMSAVEFQDKSNVYSMNLIPGEITQLTSGKGVCPDQLKHPIAAVAAIGNPDRFFTTLKALGIQFSEYTFSDHYCYQSKDFNMMEETVIMTEKDAVKCYSFATDKLYYLPVSTVIENDFWEALWAHEQLCNVV